MEQNPSWGFHNFSKISLRLICSFFIVFLQNSLLNIFMLRLTVHYISRFISPSVTFFCISTIFSLQLCISYTIFPVLLLSRKKLIFLFLWYVRYYDEEKKTCKQTHLSTFGGGGGDWRSYAAENDYLADDEKLGHRSTVVSQRSRKSKKSHHLQQVDIIWLPLWKGDREGQYRKKLHKPIRGGGVFTEVVFLASQPQIPFPYMCPCLILTLNCLPLSFHLFALSYLSHSFLPCLTPSLPPFINFTCLETAAIGLHAGSVKIKTTAGSWTLYP